MSHVRSHFSKLNFGPKMLQLNQILRNFKQVIFNEVSQRNRWTFDWLLVCVLLNLLFSIMKVKGMWNVVRLRRTLHLRKFDYCSILDILSISSELYYLCLFSRTFIRQRLQIELKICQAWKSNSIASVNTTNFCVCIKLACINFASIDFIVFLRHFQSFLLLTCLNFCSCFPLL